MKKLRLGMILTVLVAVAMSCVKLADSNDPKALFAEVAKNQAPNTLASPEKKNGWQLLFDGKTTDGWHGYNMKIFPDCWTIEDGSLTMNTTGSQESQDIITNDKYKNFALSLEYKLTKAANSGVIFQVAEDTAYKFPYETGPEFQVIDHENWTLSVLEDVQKNGANYAMYAPKYLPEEHPYKPLGDWNRILLYVKGDSVTQILNGVVVVKYVKHSDEWNALRNSGKWAAYPDWGKFDEGFISLQNHGTKVWYRDIKIKKLD
jgi:hypothetical protein